MDNEKNRTQAIGFFTFLVLGLCIYAVFGAVWNIHRHKCFKRQAIAHNCAELDVDGRFHFIEK
jgi:hypothetical protein